MGKTGGGGHQIWIINRGKVRQSIEATADRLNQPFITKAIELVPADTQCQGLTQAKLTALLAEQGLKLSPKRSGGAGFRQSVTTCLYVVILCLIALEDSSGSFVGGVGLVERKQFLTMRSIHGVRELSVQAIMKSGPSSNKKRHDRL